MYLVPRIALGDLEDKFRRDALRGYGLNLSTNLLCLCNDVGTFSYDVEFYQLGCTYLIVFGLPGQKHADDAARSLLCANDIVNRHDEIQLEASVGVATGTCYCGIVGHPQRQEYTGDIFPFLVRF
ncbi:hypothetical protein AVEN_191514-1 [Araneus ventricosus]|uniref:Guanylate cyclase domain-containing protein n=1 Tax=Araneus ventricosus TaxID=182803 RepID=A0A4Y2RTH3_ARAVE|nr:hypothetical protein AVEN_191514-1 [Araneus ventricosus]